MEHRVKCLPGSWSLIETGKKTFDIRRNDRKYTAGDTVVFEEFRSQTGTYTGRALHRRIVYVLTQAETDMIGGLKPGFCAFSIVQITAEEAQKVAA